MPLWVLTRQRHTMLAWLVVIPVVTAAVVGAMSSVERVKQVALAGTMVEALVSVLVVLQFDLSLSGYQMQVG